MIIDIQITAQDLRCILFNLCTAAMPAPRLIFSVIQIIALIMNIVMI